MIKYSIDKVDKWLEAGFVPEYDDGLNICGFNLKLPECEFRCDPEHCIFLVVYGIHGDIDEVCRIVDWSVSGPQSLFNLMSEHTRELKTLLMSYHGQIAPGIIERREINYRSGLIASCAQAGHTSGRAIAIFVRRLDKEMRIEFWGMGRGGASWRTPRRLRHDR